jgi:hypothetical protein
MTVDWVPLERSNKEKFRQCVLENDDGETTTTWLPLKHAKKGVRMTFKELLGVWVVKGVFRHVIGGGQLDAMNDSHRYHRRRTDV